MKSGLCNLKNLNSLLILVIIGLVVFCCVRQQRENFYGLEFSQLQYQKDEDGNCVLVDTGTMSNADPDCYQYIKDLSTNNVDTREMSEELVAAMQKRDEACKANSNSNDCKNAQAAIQELLKTQRNNQNNINTPTLSVNNVSDFFGKDQLIESEKLARDSLLDDYLNKEKAVLNADGESTTPLFDNRNNLRARLQGKDGKSMPDVSNNQMKILVDSLKEAHKQPEPDGHVAFSKDFTELNNISDMSNMNYTPYSN